MIASPNDLAVVSRIVRDVLHFVKEFVKRPSIFGVAVRSGSLTGRTRMGEHGAATGIRIYRRDPQSKSAAAG